ncbi:hypothetical protein IFR04_010816 [Cadophora malorum]|uniref:NmrA-like domain-containing protein n=1 Tax=Cadophora malorum TaxID=108018 RepID=A0A8H7W8C4_9HELO|nr:hypothetical protein IFR04_010816 [Cadophora malorum]
MVKIAMAGGSGQIASEILDVLVAKMKHEILILSRHGHAPDPRPGVTWAQTDYSSVTELTALLKGVDVVLSFGAAHEDVGSVKQRALIDASVAAGVKRFAPNEWSTRNFDEIPWYAEKGNVRAYLAEINKDKKVIEYTLFQPGFITDYIAPPNTSSKHISPLDIALDLPNRRAIVLDEIDPHITLTSVKDVAEVVARAVEFEGEWPVVGGMVGTTLKTSEFIALAEKIRGGKPWPITTLKEADIRAGDIKSDWIPMMNVKGLAQEQIEFFSKMVLTGFLLCGLHESWMVSDEWNRLLKDYEFESLEHFLERTWGGRP